jgi:two-component system, OmpR family, phosphate regulon sensor histidine kinase PhoR
MAYASKTWQVFNKVVYPLRLRGKVRPMRSRLPVGQIDPLSKAQIDPLSKAQIDPLSKAQIDSLSKAQIDPLSKAESSLAAHPLLTVLIETSADLIGIATLNGTCQCLNGAGQRLIGLSRSIDELKIIDFLREEERSRFEDIILPTVCKTGYWKGDVYLKHLQTEAMIASSCHWFMVTDPQTQGRSLGMMIRPTKLADPCPLDSACQTLAVGCERSPRPTTEEWSKFWAVAAHELRTPLAIIASSAEILQDFADQLDAPQRQKHFQRIQSKVKQMSQILTDLTALGDCDLDQTGKQPLATQPQEIAVAEFCRELIEDLQSRTHNHTIVFSASPELSTLQIDPTLLQRILSNLLCNSLKYSPNGGRIDLEVSRDRQFITFQVRDQGIGIPIADQQSLFQWFYRASNAGKISGTGLGLAIVKQCVEQQGGQIALTSEVNVGTTIVVKLPV